MGKVNWKDQKKEQPIVAKDNGDTWCLCPKCRGRHRVKFQTLFGAEWTGRGVPRVFCNSCRSEVAYWRDSSHYEPLDTNQQAQNRYLQTEREE